MGENIVLLVSIMPVVVIFLGIGIYSFICSKRPRAAAATCGSSTEYDVTGAGPRRRHRGRCATARAESLFADPGEVPHRRGRGPQQGGGGHRSAASRGRWGRAAAGHHLRGGPVPPGRRIVPASCTGWCSPAPSKEGSARGRSDGPALARVDADLGLRHQWPPRPEPTDALARSGSRAAGRRRGIEMGSSRFSPWTVNRALRRRYSEGPGLLVGDAVHRHPPNNGLGSNTSIQDSYNLAWKLAHVLRGEADARCSRPTTRNARRSAGRSSSAPTRASPSSERSSTPSG